MVKLVMEHKDPLQNMMNAICNMDVEGLKMALPDDELYFEMSKNTFLDKISQIFDDLKIRGNTCFSVHPGHCKSSICSNKGCNGFAFVSDFTKEHISIVIHYKEGIFDDWSHCHNMSTNTIILDDEKNIKIQVWNEDRRDFEASDDFLQTISDVKQAKILLSELSNPAINKASFILWLNRYENQFLNSFYFRNYKFKYFRSFSSFGQLFSILTDLGKIVKHETEIIKTLNEMQNATRGKHKKLFKEHEDLLSTLFRLDMYRKDGVIKLISDNDVYHFDMQDFEQIFNCSQSSHDLIYRY